MLRTTRASNARNLASLSYHPRHRRFSHLLPTINTNASRVSEYDSDAVFLLSVRVSGIHGNNIPRGKSFYSTTTTRMKDGNENAKDAKGQTTLDPPPSPHSNPTTGKQKPLGIKSSLTPRKLNGSDSTVDGTVNTSPPLTNRSSKSSSSSHPRKTEGTVLQDDLSTQPSSSKPSPQNTTTTAAHRPRSTPHLVIPKVPETLGIVKTALNDIEDAMNNGTLKPVPPDLAARLKKAAEGDKVATSGTDTVQVWWHRLKEMTKFYFFGVVTLGREHRVRARGIRRLLNESESKGIRGVQEWRWNDFLQTYRMDLLRLVPFVSIILILEEILPLIILYAPFLLPSTCKLPSQARRIDELADQKRWDALKSLGDALKLGDVSKTTIEGRLDRLPESSLPLICRLLGIAPYGPSPYLKARVRSTLATLSQEDSYFQSGSSPNSSSDPVSHLSLSELRLLLRRRGFPTSPLSLPQLRDNLTWWLAQPEHQTEKRLAALVALARSSNSALPSPSSPPSSSSSGRA